MNEVFSLVMRRRGCLSVKIFSSAVDKKIIEIILHIAMEQKIYVALKLPAKRF